MATHSDQSKYARTRTWFRNSFDKRGAAKMRQRLSVIDHDDMHRMNRMPLVYSDNRLMMTDSAAHIAAKVPMKSWAFLDHQEKQRNWSNASSFFGSVFPSDKSNSGHLIVTNRVFSADQWHANRVQMAKDDRKVSGSNISERTTRLLTHYLGASKKARLEGQYGDQFFERNVYLFTKIGERNEGEGISKLLVQALEDLIVMAAGDKEPPEPAEIAAWVEKAQMLSNKLLLSGMRVTPINQWEVEWLMRHLDTPGMPTPAMAYTTEESDFSDPRWVEEARNKQMQRGLDPDFPERGRPHEDVSKRVAPESAVERWGFGEWRTTLASFTKVESIGRGANKENLHAVRFETPTCDEHDNNVVYSCFLPLNHIPGVVFYNLNWLHESTKLGFPVDASMHFQVLNQEDTKKELDSKIRSAENQAMEDQEAGVASDESNRESHAQLEGLKTEQKKTKKPLVHWQCVLNVCDTDKERLRDRVNALINHYKQTLQMELVCPSDDQRELFYQSLPGGEVTVDDWWQTTGPEYVASAAPWLTDTIGDHRGMYQGFTITEAGSKGQPFFYDNFTVVDIEGKAPTEAVFAEPGAGKTVSRGLKCVYEDALQGSVTQFVWDPKGDFLTLYQNRIQLGIDGRVRLVDLGDPTSSVSLDAFGIAEHGVDDEGEMQDERASVARRVLSHLLTYGGGAETSAYVNLAGRAVERVMRGEEHSGIAPSMMGVLTVLHRWATKNFDELDQLNTDDELPLVPRDDGKRDRLADDASEIHRRLQGISRTKLGKPLFKPYTGNGVETMKITPGTVTIFVGMHLKIAEEGEIESEDNRTSSVIMGVMTDYIRSLLSEKSIMTAKKAATFDEWHVIKKMGGAEGLMSWMKRMGRSRRCAVRQLSQSANDFDSGSLTTVWAGWVESEDEARASCRLLGIEESTSNIKLLMNLPRGQFLFRDHKGRVAWVEIDFWDEDLLALFNTQAADKEKSQTEAAAQNAPVSSSV